MNNNINDDDHDEEEDFVPLVATETNNINNSNIKNDSIKNNIKSSHSRINNNNNKHGGIIKKQSSSSSSLFFGSLYCSLRRSRILLPIMIILLLAMCFFVYKDKDIDSSTNDINSTNKNDIDGTNKNDIDSQHPTMNKNYKQHPSQEQEQQQQHDDDDDNQEPFHNINIDVMKRNFQKTKLAFIEKLKIDYGAQTFQRMFVLENDNNDDDDVKFVSRYLFQSPSLNNDDESNDNRLWNNIKRKLIIKLLEIQIHSRTKSFVWVTGGHSATAGHGNFYDESYTSYLQKGIQPIMDSIGLNFIGKNYAMGGTNAAPELALCSNEIYGQDIDIIIWDFGMTDGRAIEKLFLYFYRIVGYNSNRPIGLAYHNGGRWEKIRNGIMSKLNNEYQLTILSSSEEIMNTVINTVPDSFGLAKEQIDQMPIYIRDFKCNRQIETGEPFCGTNKFNNTQCTDRKYRTSWHPGWKWHALMGNMAAMFLIEVLGDALNEIASSQNDDPLIMLNKLKAEEDAEYEHFYHTAIPTDVMQYFFDKEQPMDESILDIITRGHSYCHTARLPSEIRYKGILTESSKKIGLTSYDTGIEWKTANANPSDDGSMRLTYYDEERYTCAIPTIMDYKDFFYASEKEDWVKLVLPNNAEVTEYGIVGELYAVNEGIIGFCFTLCSWGKCPPGVLKRDDFFSGKFQMKINGQNVENLKQMQDCELTVGADGKFKWPANDEGKFVIQVKVHEPSSYIRFSSVIVWPIQPSPKFKK